MVDAYFTEERIKNYLAHEDINARYNLDLLKLEGIKPYNLSGGRVLDFGCGFGKLLEPFRINSYCYGVDVSEYAIKTCRHRHKDMVFAQDTKIPFDFKFHLIMCFGTLGIMDKDKHEAFIKDCSKHLTDNGILIATAPNPYRPRIMGKRIYENGRDMQSWRSLCAKADLQSNIYTVLRIPIGNIFLKVAGDPIVIAARFPSE